MITDTFPTLWNILNASLNLYNDKLQQEQGQLNHELNVLLQILKKIFRIFFISIFMSLPKYLQNIEILEQWFNIFLKFFQIKAPIDLKLPYSNMDISTITSYSTQKYAKYYNNAYVKCRKWAVRCIVRIFQLYGRPRYCLNRDIKPMAQVFMDKYSLKFMELFYFGIIRQHIGDQFVYYKTLAPAITYMHLCMHYGKLFNLFLENNAKYLENILFVCMFRIIRLTAKDLITWKDDPSGFVDNVYATSDSSNNSYDPRTEAGKFINDITRIRSRYVFDKLLQFAQKIIKDSYQMQQQMITKTQQNEKNNDKPDPKYLDTMLNKDAILCILGNLSKTLVKSKTNLLKDLIIKYVLCDFDSQIGFIRSRACWLVGKYWKLSFSTSEWNSVTMSLIQCLHDHEIPVQTQASQGLSRIVLERTSSVINFIKPQIPSILDRYLEIMNDIGSESVVQTFDTFIDRLDRDIIPFATDLLKKMMKMMDQFHCNIEIYIKTHPERYTNFRLPSGKIANQSNGAIEWNNNQSDESQREELRLFDDSLASAMQCLKTMHTILFSSTALPSLLIKLKEIMKPLINNLFTDNYLYYQFYNGEILDFIYLFTYYMNPLSRDLWQILPKILDGYCNNIYPEQFNRCVQCTTNYIKTSYEYHIPMDIMINEDYMDSIFKFAEIAIHDVTVNSMIFHSLFENILCCFKDVVYIDMNKYIPKILDMTINKYTESELAPSTQDAMLAMLSLISYNNPTLFIELLEKQNSTEIILNRLMNRYQDLQWQQQKALVFGLSSLLLIQKKNVTQTLFEKYAKILDVISKTVIYMNWEEESDDGDDDDDDDDDDSDDDKDDITINNNQSDDAMEQCEVNIDNVNDNNNNNEDEMDEFDEKNVLLDVDGNDDYVDESDIQFLQQMSDVNDNVGWMTPLLDNWEDNSQIVPRSKLDEENEMIYFDECLSIFDKKYPMIVQEWRNKLNKTNTELLNKYLKDSQQNIKDYQKRKILHETEKYETKQMAMRAMQSVKQINEEIESKIYSNYYQLLIIGYLREKENKNIIPLIPYGLKQIIGFYLCAKL